MKWKLEHSPKKEHGTGLEYVPAFRVTPSRGRRIDINYLSHHYCETPEQAALHKKNAEANAKLIAAAPELLEACKHLVAILSKEDEDFYNKHIHAFNLGMDAIKKAER